MINIELIEHIYLKRDLNNVNNVPFRQVANKQIIYYKQYNVV